MMTLEDFEQYLKDLDENILDPYQCAFAPKEEEEEEGKEGKKMKSKEEGTEGKEEMNEIDPHNHDKHSHSPHNLFTLWRTYSFPRIHDIVRGTVKSGRNRIKERKHSFDIVGFDFMIDEEMNPWLLEVTLSPCFRHTTKLVGELVEDVVESTMKGLVFMFI